MMNCLDLDSLIDTQDVDAFFGLAQHNVVSSYQIPDPDLPRPVIDLGQVRCGLRLRTGIEALRADRDSPVSS